jgi:DNA-directed RNA polymerase subunit RPC12/RpoP
MGIRYVCGACTRTLEAWDEGNPYYLDDDGGKHYAYHPDHELLQRCVGNDRPHLCLDCGNELTIDSRSPVTSCARCLGTRVIDVFELDGRSCPYCKKGCFVADPNWHPIS